MTRSTPIYWDDLESAFERNAPDTECFLSLATGHVVCITMGSPEAPVLKEKVASEIHDHVRIDPASSREQYRWMERYVTSVEDEGLRTRLLMAIDGKGAFRRFKDVLVSYPAERERWFTYRSDLLHWHMAEWLKEKDIEASVPAPWGDPAPPRELPEVTVRPVVHTSESPGEPLRRHAREIIDALPAIELPSALAFLEFLRSRGGEVDTGRPRRDEPDATAEVEPLRRRASTDLGDASDVAPGPVDALAPAAPPLAARAAKR